MYFPVYTIHLNTTFKGKMQQSLKTAFLAIMDTLKLLSAGFIRQNRRKARALYSDA